MWDAQVWPSVHELLIGYCVALESGVPYQASQSHSGSGEVKEGSTSWVGRLRAPTGTGDGGSARRRSRSRSHSRSRSNSASSTATGENIYELAGTVLLPFVATISGAGAQQGGKRASVDYAGFDEGHRRMSSGSVTREDFDVSRRHSRSHTHPLTPSGSLPLDTATARGREQGDTAHPTPVQRIEQGGGGEVEASALPTQPIEASAANVVQPPEQSEQPATSHVPPDLQGSARPDDHSGLGSGQGDEIQAPSVDGKERQPSPPPPQAPPPVRRMSTGGIFPNTPNPILLHSQRLASKPPSITPTQPPAQHVQPWQTEGALPTSNTEANNDSDQK